MTTFCYPALIIGDFGATDESGFEREGTRSGDSPSNVSQEARSLQNPSQQPCHDKQGDKGGFGCHSVGFPYAHKSWFVDMVRTVRHFGFQNCHQRRAGILYTGT